MEATATEASPVTVEPPAQLSPLDRVARLALIRESARRYAREHPAPYLVQTRREVTIARHRTLERARQRVQLGHAGTFARICSLDASSPDAPPVLLERMAGTSTRHLEEGEGAVSARTRAQRRRLALEEGMAPSRRAVALEALDTTDGINLAEPSAEGLNIPQLEMGTARQD